MFADPKPLIDYPWFLRPWLWWQRRRYGRVLATARLWARSPRLFLGSEAMRRATERRSSPLEPALRGLVGVRVGQINRCPFNIDLHAGQLQRHGVGRDKLEALEDWRESAAFTNRERVVLEYAEVVTRSDTPVTADVVGAVKRHLDEAELIELAGLIAYQNLATKFSSALDVPPQGFYTMTASEGGEAVAQARGEHGAED